MLIADEPTTALDVTIQAHIVELLQDLGAQLGMAIIWITHDLGMIAGIADRVMVMYGGQVVKLAPREAPYHNPLHPYTQTLLSAVPKPDAAHAQTPQSRKILRGDVPSPANPPKGCNFCTWCPKVMARCKIEAPNLQR